MRKGIYILPNSITLCGMFAGFYAIVSAMKGNYVHAAWGIIIAGVFDGLDGWVARLTNTNSRFGIELDSLSDVIAFGVAPAVLLYRWAMGPFGRVGWAIAFLFTACGALRLARYNIQMGSSEKKSFTGMPIPAAAGIVSAVVMFSARMDWSPHKSYPILALTVVLSLLMVSTLRFHGLKELNIKGRKPFWILVIIAVVFVLVVMHPETALFAIGALYLIVGIAENSYLYLKRVGGEKKPA